MVGAVVTRVGNSLPARRYLRASRGRFSRRHIIIFSRCSEVQRLMGMVACRAFQVAAGAVESCRQIHVGVRCMIEAVGWRHSVAA